MSNLLLLQNGIAAALSADTRLTGLTPRPATVTTHSGRFDEDAIRRYLKRAPAAVVSCLGGEAGMRGERMLLDASMAVFCCTTDKAGSPRVSGQLELVDAVLRALNPLTGAIPALDEVMVSRPMNLRARNLYSGKLDSEGVALWVVTWDQQIELQDVFTADALNLIVANWDLPPLVSDGDPEYEATDYIGLNVVGVGSSVVVVGDEVVVI